MVVISLKCKFVEYIGLVMIYDSTSDLQRVYCELSWSPNMYDWYRVNPGQEFIPLSPLESLEDTIFWANISELILPFLYQY